MNQTLPHLEVVIPIYNEADNLPLLVQRLDDTARGLRDVAKVSYLFINDGSTDGSSGFLKHLYEKRGDVRVVELIHNFGHGAALSAGIDHFEGDIAAFMDADLQDAPEALVPMLDAWKRGAKTVVAERGSRRERGRLFFKAFYFLLHKIAPDLPPINFGTHSLIDGSVVRRMRALKEKNRYFPGLVAFASEKITPIHMPRDARAHGDSRVGTFGLINLALTAFLSFSSTPVKFVSVLGLVCSVGSLTVGVVILCIKLFTDKAIPGWASMMTIMAFGSGIQLLCLGIIGEYIARIYDEVKQRPLYMVDQVHAKPELRQTLSPAAANA